MKAHQHKRRNAGFTLIEMLIVIIILGVLAMIIVPQITSSTDEARLRTAETNVSAMRSAVEIFYAQHTSIYPGDVLPTTKPADVTDLAETFVAQMTRYTDVNGNIANVKTAVFKYGPYIKGGSLPTNPYNEKNDVTIDNTETDITVRDSTGDLTGWKFYTKTGVLILADGAHDTL